MLDEIKAKGFDMTNSRTQQLTDANGYAPPVDYNKVKVGLKTLNDASLNLSILTQINPNLANKVMVLRAIDNYDLQTMREISDFFYKTSGIYNRIVRYMAFMYKYDWFVTPIVKDKKQKAEKILDGFYNVLHDLDAFNVKKVLGDIALKVIKDGVYYGYVIDENSELTIQDLPAKYCRSRYYCGNMPAVEFNMRFFDEQFIDGNLRTRVLKMFPKEFRKGYLLYKKGKLMPEYPGDTSGWYLLDPKYAVKFNMNGDDFPPFISVVPLILDLDAAQELDRKKTEQRLLRILVQHMPTDKNGDLIFDVDEAQQLHNNAVQMLGRAIGIDVLTTFADVTVENLSDSNVASSQSDDLERVERQLYNEAGVSQMQFNTSGNLALEKSLLNDAATMSNLLYQFDVFLNRLISKYNKNIKKIEYKVQILHTTIYNYQELAKTYKEQMQVGFSKMLPQVALGQSQSSILANAFFENEILDLVNVFIPPLMSSTMNSDTITAVSGGQIGKKNGDDSEGSGRKELPDDEKSERTIQNRESMS